MKRLASLGTVFLAKWKTRIKIIYYFYLGKLTQSLVCISVQWVVITREVLVMIPFLQRRYY